MACSWLKEVFVQKSKTLFLNVWDIKYRMAVLTVGGWEGLNNTNKKCHDTTYHTLYNRLERIQRTWSFNFEVKVTWWQTQ